MVEAAQVVNTWAAFLVGFLAMGFLPMHFSLSSVALQYSNQFDSL